MNLTRLIVPLGRIGRREYLWTLAPLLVLVALAVAFLPTYAPQYVQTWRGPVLKRNGANPMFLALWFLSWPWFCLAARRAHDIGRSAGWVLLWALAALVCLPIGMFALWLAYLLLTHTGPATHWHYLAAVMGTFAVALFPAMYLSVVLACSRSAVGINTYGLPGSGSVLSD